MEYTYTLVKSNGNMLIQRQPDGAWIPKDDANCCYMKYLEWCKDNVPLVEDWDAKALEMEKGEVDGK